MGSHHLKDFVRFCDRTKYEKTPKIHSYGTYLHLGLLLRVFCFVRRMILNAWHGLAAVLSTEIKLCLILKNQL